jgi:hypothetical protein
MFRFPRRLEYHILVPLDVVVAMLVAMLTIEEIRSPWILVAAAVFQELNDYSRLEHRQDLCVPV